MMRFQFAAPLAAFVALLLATSAAPAAFHLWSFTEVFSNHDGSVQFIEMVASGPFETVASGAQIRTTSGANVFSFPGNLSGNTANRRLLIATAGFAALPGAVTPDFTLPETSFFNPAGDTIRIFHPSFGEFHSRTFASTPTDGLMSLNYPPVQGGSAANTPTNYAGATGAVNVPPPPTTTGDYNGDLTVDAADYTVWRDTLGDEVTAGSGADGVPDGTIDLEDYEFWKMNFGDVVGGSASSTAAVVVPEPTVLSFAVGGMVSLCVAAVRTRTSCR